MTLLGEKTSMTEDAILSDLLQACERYFRLKVLDASPIKIGYLNLKWKLTTDSGAYLLKQYNQKRLQLYDQKALLEAFQLQMKLYDSGLPCPKLHSYEGRYFLTSKKSELFLLMDYCDGEIVPPGKTNEAQMFELGKTAGFMHHLLNEQGLRKTPQFIMPDKDDRLKHWRTLQHTAETARNDQQNAIFKKLHSVTSSIDWNEFVLGETGWSHRDLWMDNLLFDDKKLCAILDFDRMKYDYPQLDAARAVISGALDNGRLDVKRVRAFMEGYNIHCPMDEKKMVQSLKLLWLMESTWWITEDMADHKGPPIRFAEEMLWLTDNFFQLEDVFKNT
ncbi:phosphotransferase [Falsibacillus pallidus]|uniref:phosphotransferase n=1 Tax=Falsibacillus pallidus TaxID=493781 RepID=UPI003D96FE8B